MSTLSLAARRALPAVLAAAGLAVCAAPAGAAQISFDKTFTQLCSVTDVSNRPYPSFVATTKLVPTFGVNGSTIALEGLSIKLTPAAGSSLPVTIPAGGSLTLSGAASVFFQTSPVGGPRAGDISTTVDWQATVTGPEVTIEPPLIRSATATRDTATPTLVKYEGLNTSVQSSGGGFFYFDCQPSNATGDGGYGAVELGTIPADAAPDPTVPTVKSVGPRVVLPNFPAVVNVTGTNLSKVRSATLGGSGIWGTFPISSRQVILLLPPKKAGNYALKLRAGSTEIDAGTIFATTTW